MTTGADWPELVEVRWDDTHRLIPDAYADTDEPYLAALVGEVEDRDADLAALTDLTGATNKRLEAQAGRDLGGIGPHELLFETPYSKVVNGAFTYRPVGGYRFSDRHRGAWYAARELETSLAEVAFHRGLMLSEIAREHDEVIYVDYLADVHGAGFADLTGTDPRTLACLEPDSYANGQDLAGRLLAGGASGVTYTSVRRPAGLCLAVFKPAMVAHVRPGGRYRLTWSSGTGPDITQP